MRVAGYTATYLIKASSENVKKKKSLPASIFIQGDRKLLLQQRKTLKLNFKLHVIKSFCFGNI